jgi:hypothetical protein
MSFDSKTAKKAGKKSKRGPAKKEGPSIKEKMEMLYEKVLDDLLINQDKLTKTERVKVFVTLSGYLFPKNKLNFNWHRKVSQNNYCSKSLAFILLVP